MAKSNLVVPAVLFALVVSVVGGAWLYWQNELEELESGPSPTIDSQAPRAISGQTMGEDYDFTNPKKSAHYESNSPAHGEVVPNIPVSVVVDFNFDLANGSDITISREGRDYGIGPTIIDDNRLSMRQDMSPNAPDGVYTVIYQACWPDRTCHDGFFQFAIDRSMAGGYIDQTGRTEVTISMSNLAFQPAMIRISRGTTVTWYNNDTVEHFVNTDPHPAHTQHPNFSSRSIAPGESYRYTFEKPGAYSYHCSAHASIMVGSIIVE